jgi:DNA-binding MarR family transcriptional regulator
MLRYLEFMNKMHQINDDFNLDSYEARLLELVANAHHSDKPLFISDLIHQKHIASQSTLHSAVQRLITKRLITAKILKSDKRTKTVSLTKISCRRFEKLNKEMVQATTP